MKVRTVLRAGVLGLCASIIVLSSAAAGDAPYLKVGRWSVVAVSGASGFQGCAADLDNGRMTLRIMTTGKGWQVGYPAKGRKRTIETYFGFEIAGEVGNFRANGEGWAFMSIDRDQVEAFRTLPSFDLTFDAGEQSWKLEGAAAALAAASECLRSGGRRPLPA